MRMVFCAIRFQFFSNEIPRDLDDFPSVEKFVPKQISVEHTNVNLFPNTVFDPFGINLELSRKPIEIIHFDFGSLHRADAVGSRQ